MTVIKHLDWFWYIHISILYSFMYLTFVFYIPEDDRMVKRNI